MPVVTEGNIHIIELLSFIISVLALLLSIFNAVHVLHVRKQAEKTLKLISK